MRQKATPNAQQVQALETVKAELATRDHNNFGRWQQPYHSSAWMQQQRMKGLILAPCGFGKTLLMTFIAHEYAQKSEDIVVILVPSQELTRQWVREILCRGPWDEARVFAVFSGSILKEDSGLAELGLKGSSCST